MADKKTLGLFLKVGITIFTLVGFGTVSVIYVNDTADKSAAVATDRLDSKIEEHFIGLEALISHREQSCEKESKLRQEKEDLRFTFISGAMDKLEKMQIQQNANIKDLHSKIQDIDVQQTKISLKVEDILGMSETLAARP